MPEVPTPDPAARIAELEAEVARLKVAQELIAAERDAYREQAGADPFADEPYTSPTPDEVQEMMHGPRGTPLEDIFSEFGLGGGES